MGKKINEDDILIKKLIEKKMPAWKISKQYGIKKQKISYWKYHDIKTVIKRRSMGTRKITMLMNEKFKKEGRDLKISHMISSRILNKNLGKPRKIKKIFYINNKKKEERIKYCHKIQELGLKGKDIFFTDESIMDLSPFVNEKIRLSKENNEKLKKGDPEALNLLNKQADKCPKRILIAGGISYYG